MQGIQCTCSSFLAVGLVAVPESVGHGVCQHLWSSRH